MHTIVAHDSDTNACLYFMKACFLQKLPIFLPEDILRIILQFCDQTIPDIIDLAYMDQHVPWYCRTVPISVSIASLPLIPFQIEIYETVLYDISESYEPFLDPYMQLTACVKLCKLLYHFDTQNIHYGVRKSRDLFARLLDEDAVRERYRPLVKCGVRETIKVKMNSRTRVWYRLDSKNVRPGHISDIRRGVKVHLIASTKGLWSASRSFGMSLFAKDVLVVSAQH